MNGTVITGSRLITVAFGILMAVQFEKLDLTGNYLRGIIHKSLANLYNDEWAL